MVHVVVELESRAQIGQQADTYDEADAEDDPFDLKFNSFHH
jgi:hypothetical protein